MLNKTQRHVRRKLMTELARAFVVVVVARAIRSSSFSRSLYAYNWKIIIIIIAEIMIITTIAASTFAKYNVVARRSRPRALNAWRTNYRTR